MSTHEKPETDHDEATDEAVDDSTPEQSEGELSEVASFDEKPEPIAPDQAVAGYPPSESGHPDEGPAGPNARTGSAD